MVVVGFKATSVVFCYGRVTSSRFLTCTCDVLEADTVKYANRNSIDSAYRDLLRRFFFDAEVPMVADSRSLKRKVLIDAFSGKVWRGVSVPAPVENKHIHSL